MDDVFEKAAALTRLRLDDLAARAEDPEKLLRHVAEDIVDNSHAIRRGVRPYELRAEQLRKQAQRERQIGLDWEKRAYACVRAGDDALAKEALRMRRDFFAQADALDAELAREEQVVKDISTIVADLESKRGTALAFARIFSALEIPSLAGRDPAPVLELLTLLEERALASEVG